jgi:hypothetical protein
MEFKTKFDNGDTVWIMHNSEALELRIIGVDVMALGNDPYCVTYVGRMDDTGQHEFPESDAHRSLEDLLEALYGVKVFRNKKGE